MTDKDLLNKIDAELLVAKVMKARTLWNGGLDPRDVSDIIRKYFKDISTTPAKGL